MKSISVGIPVYNESPIIPELVSRTIKAFSGSGCTLHEIIFVDDASHDGTLHTIETTQKTHPLVKYISFSRNFGHQIAISAAIDHAKGDALIIMDGDLQDPPETIPRLLDAWGKGHQVVYAERTHRNGETWFKLITAKIFYRVLGFFSDVPIPFDTGDFCLIDRVVIDVLKKMPERARFVRGLRAWVGFSSIGVPYERDARKVGETKYPLSKMLRFAINGILSFSTLPFRFATYCGMIVAGLSFLAGILVLVVKLASDVLLPGWTSIVLAVAFMGGIQLLVLGILGEYIGRLYEEVRGRPLYVVRHTSGFEDFPHAQ